MICSVVEKAPGIFYIYDEDGHYIDSCHLTGDASLLGFTATTVTINDGHGWIRVFNEHGQQIASHQA